MPNYVKISLGRKHHKVLREEFLPRISRQTIFNALTYRSNTPNSIAIRKKAKNLLLQEVELIEKNDLELKRNPNN
ncbi:MAG: hypothetical protein N4A37_05620 [Prolixibacteraceae bacterium]|jgi:hypothetical protein|nr:hypothetical protein [Prolixibacteraceae bacterium]